MPHRNLEKMRATTLATQERRKAQDLRVVELKFVRNRLSKGQLAKLDRMFLEAKWLHNAVLETGLKDWRADLGLWSRDKDGHRVEQEFRALPAHCKQGLVKRLKANAKTLATLKKQGKKVGRLRFTSQVNVLDYSTGDLKWKGGAKVYVPKLGWVRVRGTQQLKEKELADARLVRRADGLFLKICVMQAKEPEPQTWPTGSAVGLDMGIKAHVTLSTGEARSVTVGESERLKGLQRKLARQVKGSNNSERTRAKIQREYARMDHRKAEAANKLVRELTRDHQYVFLQDEQLAGWRELKQHGLQHSALGRVKAGLARHERAIMLDKWSPTTQWCPACGGKNKLALSERQYVCPCGYTEDRDVHSARNMVRLGLTSLPPEQRDTLVEGMLARDGLIQSGLLFPVKQATSKASKPGGSGRTASQPSREASRSWASAS